MKLFLSRRQLRFFQSLRTTQARERENEKAKKRKREKKTKKCMHFCAFFCKRLSKNALKICKFYIEWAYRKILRFIRNSKGQSTINGSLFYERPQHTNSVFKWARSKQSGVVHRSSYLLPYNRIMFQPLVLAGFI